MANKVTAWSLTDGEIDAEITACRGDKAQAESLIADCYLARTGSASACRRIAAAINARREGSK